INSLERHRDINLSCIVFIDPEDQQATLALDTKDVRSFGTIKELVHKAVKRANTISREGGARNASITVTTMSGLGTHILGVGARAQLALCPQKYSLTIVGTTSY
ncbi:hypothetical protein C0991_006421, partial [Blastosporella zonata]